MFSVACFFTVHEHSVESKELLGYFTLALKPLSVRGETVSKTTKRKLLRISELDEKSDTYTMSAYLIAQLGKNYTNGANNKITGKELVELVWTVIEDAQYMLGGIVTFLEAENEERLLSFYRDNRFSQFDTRQTTSDTDEAHELVQLLRLVFLLGLLRFNGFITVAGEPLFFTFLMPLKRWRLGRNCTITQKSGVSVIVSEFCVKV